MHHATLKITSPHFICLPVISISFCTNNRVVIVGPTEMESMIKELWVLRMCCGQSRCPPVAVSPYGNYEEKRKESEMKDAETGREVKLRQIVMRINEQAAKLRIIKPIHEKSLSPPVALGCKPASCLY